MPDFTLTIYKRLLNELRNAKYEFNSFAEYLMKSDSGKKTIILRHDVDKKPKSSVETAKIENRMGIRGTYYFRVKKSDLPKKEIKAIAALGHEIGYHYEDLDIAEGDVGVAMKIFQKNLACLREITPIKTACMHGSPLSRHDSRYLWKDSDYHKLGIIGEPYFDIDFSKVLYLTDTGRRWDGSRVSIRDKVIGQGLEAIGYRQEKKGDGPGAIGYKEEKRGIGQLAIGNRDKGRLKTEDRKQKESDYRGAACDPPVLCLHSTMDIIKALKNNQLPKKIMLTIHPQRWTDNYIYWMKELIWQNVKNGVKYFLVWKK